MAPGEKDDLTRIIDLGEFEHDPDETLELEDYSQPQEDELPEEDSFGILNEGESDDELQEIASADDFSDNNFSGDEESYSADSGDTSTSLDEESNDSELEDSNFSFNEHETDNSEYASDASFEDPTDFEQGDDEALETTTQDLDTDLEESEEFQSFDEADESFSFEESSASLDISDDDFSESPVEESFSSDFADDSDSSQKQRETSNADKEQDSDLTHQENERTATKDLADVTSLNSTSEPAQIQTQVPTPLASGRPSPQSTTSSQGDLQTSISVHDLSDPLIQNAIAEMEQSTLDRSASTLPQTVHTTEPIEGGAPGPYFHMIIRDIAHDESNDQLFNALVEHGVEMDEQEFEQRCQRGHLLAAQLTESQIILISHQLRGLSIKIEVIESSKWDGDGELPGPEAIDSASQNWQRSSALTPNAADWSQIQVSEDHKDYCERLTEHAIVLMNLPALNKRVLESSMDDDFSDPPRQSLNDREGGHTDFDQLGQLEKELVREHSSNRQLQIVYAQLLNRLKQTAYARGMQSLVSLKFDVRALEEEHDPGRYLITASAGALQGHGVSHNEEAGPQDFGDDPFDSTFDLSDDHIDEGSDFNNDFDD